MTVISVSEDDWTAERVIIVSNVNNVHVDDWTAKLAITASNVYQPPTKLQKGNVFTGVCHSVHGV